MEAFGASEAQVRQHGELGIGEKRVLVALAKRPGKFVTLDELANELNYSRSSIQQRVFSIRQAYGTEAIETRKGWRGSSGYRLNCKVLATA